MRGGFYRAPYFELDAPIRQRNVISLGFLPLGRSTWTEDAARRNWDFLILPLNYTASSIRQSVTTGIALLHFGNNILLSFDGSSMTFFFIAFFWY